MGPIMFVVPTKLFLGTEYDGHGKSENVLPKAKRPRGCAGLSDLVKPGYTAKVDDIARAKKREGDRSEASHRLNPLGCFFLFFRKRKKDRQGQEDDSPDEAPAPVMKRTTRPLGGFEDEAPANQHHPQSGK